MALLIVCCAACGASAQGRMGQPAEALVTLERSPGWTVGIRHQIGRRDFRADSTDLDVDIVHTVGKLGYSVLPFLRAEVEVGYCRAEQVEMGIDGERGVEWSGRVCANLLEHVLQASPVVGKQHYVNFGVTAAYTQSESNFREIDFSWSEILVTPTLTYVADRGPVPAGLIYEPTGAALRSGLSFSGVDGDYGNEVVEGARDFGVLLGADVRWSSGWLARLDCTFFGKRDHTLSLGLTYDF